MSRDAATEEKGPTLVFAIGTDTYGGAESYMQDLLDGAVRQGYDVHLVGRFPANVHPKVSVHELPLGPKWSSRTIFKSGLSWRREQKMYLAKISSLRPTAIHFQFKREQILLTRVLGKQYRVVWTEHGRFPGGPLGALLKRMYRRSSGSVSSIICVSPDVQADLAGRISVDREVLQVVLNPVDRVKFAPNVALRIASRKEFGFTDSDVVYVSLSRLEQVKGVDRVLKAVSLLPKTSVVLVAGEGRESENLKRLSSELGVRAIFTGFTSHPERILQAGDVYCVGSRPDAREGAPLSVLQALSVGLPVVAASDSGLSDWLDSRGGIVADPDPISFATALKRGHSAKEQIIEQATPLLAEHDSTVWSEETVRIIVGLRNDSPSA